MEIVDVELVPRKMLIVIVFFEDISQPCVLVVDPLVIHLHIFFYIHHIFITLVGALVHFLLVGQSHLGGVMVDFLVDLFIGKRPHHLEVLVGTDVGHFVV